MKIFLNIDNKKQRYFQNKNVLSTNATLIISLTIVYRKESAK